MNKALFILFFLLAGKSFACSCDTPEPAIEFYQSQYVFKGEVVEKVYSSDSLTYTLTFRIDKHYKNSDGPEYLKFELTSEGEFTGIFTSCDWSVDKAENWLVYAHYVEGELRFQNQCSNSKLLGKHQIPPSEQKVLENGEQLDLYKYRYNFVGADAVTDVDFILNDYRNMKFDPSGAVFMWLDVDRRGKLEQANLMPRGKSNHEVIDTIFGLNNYANEFVSPRSEFERTALEIARKIEEWEEYYILDLQKPVRYRTFLTFFVGKDSVLRIER